MSRDTDQVAPSAHSGGAGSGRAAVVRAEEMREEVRGCWEEPQSPTGRPESGEVQRTR